MTFSRAAQLLRDLPARCCRWPHGDLALPSFRWCSKSALPEKPYCERHQMLAHEHDAEAAPDEVIEESGARYVMRRRGWKWKAVPNRLARGERRAPGGASAEPVPAVAPRID